MRVLQFGRFWNENHGGVERHVASLCKGLAAQGAEVVNLVAAAGLQGSDELLDGYRLVQAPSFGMAFRTAMSPALVMKALQLHREKPFDIFHLHFQDPLTHLASLLLPAQVKRVITWHHDIVRQKRLLALYKPSLQRELRRADALVAATAAHFDTSTQIPVDIPPQRRHVIPYGMDFSALQLTEHTAALADELRARAGQRKLVFALGRHVSYKGFDVLIDAMRQVDAVLMLGGSGPLTQELQQQAQAQGVADRILFIGRIPEPDLAAYFHACDLFCLPSVSEMEAFGLVQLEAMACGKPVVCTQLGNGVNVVNVHGETGLAVPVGDALALAQALQHLLQDAGLRERLGAKGRARAFGLYSQQAMTAAHGRLYQDLLVQKRAA
ncbi:glycosyltransferase [Ramlibacter sp. 2FC]|uniref:glycosyltransferase n=1 Tax=Ramlibacter sp. 2FC TaxID=2502188 RepID=UPI0010F80603|nr:glycosyltransferase [Ramlibacter sp. 2FC]